MNNNGLTNANKKKNDEFFTQYYDIEKEVSQYVNLLQGKTIYCNCDNPLESEFVKYFKRNFESLGLSQLFATGMPGIKYTKNASGGVCGKMIGNGDFSSEESIELLKQSDIVITNPPFSLFRQFLKTLLDYDKKFLIIGCQTALGYKEIFPLLKDNIIWTGYHYGNMLFRTPNGELKAFGNITWFTNLNQNNKDFIPLTKTYSPEKYKKYDNYDAIDVSRVKNIPKDYFGVMGVPITFMLKYNPEQFEIIKFRKGNDGKELSIDGKFPYSRILIKRKQ